MVKLVLVGVVLLHWGDLSKRNSKIWWNSWICYR